MADGPAGHVGLSPFKGVRGVASKLGQKRLESSPLDQISAWV